MAGTRSQDVYQLRIKRTGLAISTQMTQILQMLADLFNLCKSVKSVSSACKKLFG